MADMFPLRDEIVNYLTETLTTAPSQRPDSGYGSLSAVSDWTTRSAIRVIRPGLSVRAKTALRVLQDQYKSLTFDSRATFESDLEAIGIQTAQLLRESKVTKTYEDTHAASQMTQYWRKMCTTSGLLESERT